MKNLGYKAAFMLQYLLEGNPLKMDIEIDGVPMRVACEMHNLELCIVDQNELKCIDMTLKEFLVLVDQMNDDEINVLEMNRAMSKMYSYKEDEIKWT